MNDCTPLPRNALAPNWDIGSIVAELRGLRDRSLDNRQRSSKPPRLPARKALIDALEGLRATLFPNRLGLATLTDESVDYFVGHTLDTALRNLLEQVQLELRYTSGLEDALAINDSLHERSFGIVQDLAVRLPEIRRLLETDLAAAYDGDPAAHGIDEILICYPGITAITYHRFAHELHRLGVPLIARMIAEISHSTTGIDIHPGATIGESFFIDHGTGVVIGETTEIGNRVRLYQAVTLGAKRFTQDENGALVKGIPRHPIIEDDVVIYAGATILGRITIGRGSSIGGNVWLTHSVPPGSRITQSRTIDEPTDFSI
jgi:serine O-acetyltransferase